MLVSEIMTTPAVTIRPDASVGAAAEAMLEQKISCLPVIEGGHLVGIISHTDFGLRPRHLALSDHLYTLLGEWASPEQMEEVARGLRGRKVREVMRHPVVSVEADRSVEDVVETMIRHRVHRLPVMRGDEVVGVVSRHDLLKLFARGLAAG